MMSHATLDPRRGGETHMRFDMDGTGFYMDAAGHPTGLATLLGNDLYAEIGNPFQAEEHHLPAHIPFRAPAQNWLEQAVGPRQNVNPRRNDYTYSDLCRSMAEQGNDFCSLWDQDLDPDTGKDDMPAYVPHLAHHSSASHQRHLALPAAEHTRFDPASVYYGGGFQMGAAEHYTDSQIHNPQAARPQGDRFEPARVEQQRGEVSTVAENRTIPRAKQQAPEGSATVMMFSIPAEATSQHVTDLLEEHGFAGTYDTVQMPSSKKKTSLGYAFIHFWKAEDAARCISMLQDVSFPNCDSDKLASTKLASDQSHKASAKDCVKKKCRRGKR